MLILELTEAQQQTFFDRIVGIEFDGDEKFFGMAIDCPGEESVFLEIWIAKNPEALDHQTIFYVQYIDLDMYLDYVNFKDTL
jgi:hypothetical protein